MATQFYKTLEDWQKLKSQQSQKIQEKIQLCNSHIDENFDTELDNIKKLAGLNNAKFIESIDQPFIDSSARQQFIRENNIEPGTPRWFKVMFALQRLTGEDPFGEDNG